MQRVDQHLGDPKPLPQGPAYAGEVPCLQPDGPGRHHRLILVEAEDGRPLFRKPPNQPQHGLQLPGGAAGAVAQIEKRPPVHLGRAVRQALLIDALPQGLGKGQFAPVQQSQQVRIREQPGSGSACGAQHELPGIGGEVVLGGQKHLPVLEFQAGGLSRGGEGVQAAGHLLKQGIGGVLPQHADAGDVQPQKTGGPGYVRQIAPQLPGLDFQLQRTALLRLGDQIFSKRADRGEVGLRATS